MTARALLAVPAALLALVAPVAAATHVSGTDVSGTPGDDRLAGTASGDSIDGHRGDDLVLGRAGNDFLSGGDGRDVVGGGPGNDDAHGGRGGDRLSGGPGRDVLDGAAGRDVVRGGSGADFLADYDDGDLLLGGRGDDLVAVLSEDPGTPAYTRLHLGPGDDLVTVNDDGQPDLLDCGPGQDVAEWVTTLDPTDQYVGCEVVQEYLGP